jgi:SAM-dependent methyltransferase
MLVKHNVAVFDEDAAAFDGYRYSHDGSLSRRMSNSRTSKAIAQAASFAGKRVLDVGCGDGRFTLELAPEGAALVIGIDPTEHAIASAKKRASEAGLSDRVQFRVENVYELERSSDRYDIAVLRGVLHHVPDPGRAVLAVASVASELVILEPNGLNPVLKLIERLSPYHRQHEEQSFAPRTVDRWLAKAGKKPVDRRLINLVPLFCPDLLARLLKWAEPWVEATPVLRAIGCGQYLVRGV